MPPRHDDGRGWTGGRLASALGELKPWYDVVVVGSGYGGAVTAARLAGPGRSVCVLERGRELRPGDYPDTLGRAVRQLQVDLPGRHLFSPSALYDFRVNPDLNVFVGCGLGGTSLINASVALRPDDAVFASPDWPRAIREGGCDALDVWFDRAKKMLEVQPTRHQDRPDKLRVLDEILKALDGPGTSRICQDAELAVTPPRADGGAHPNDAGVPQRPCVQCGDCVSGCNYEAKNTLIMNYLPVARRRGAEIFTEIQARSVEPVPGAAPDSPRRWRVHVELLGSGRARFGDRPLFVTARTVILAAGALGSPELLLRSRERWGLGVSDTLGRKFSGNGDMLAFAYNTRDPANAIGFGARSPHGWLPPGPCISGYARVPERGPGALLEDGVIPGALAPFVSLGFIVAKLFTGRTAAKQSDRRGSSLWRLLDEHLRGGASATQIFLAMVSDPSHGELVLDDDRIRVRWPGAGRGGEYASLERRLIEASASPEIGAVYLPSPFGAVTVHPLGGCVMADDVDGGVVDHAGAVFTRHGGVHPGLHVADASIIPGALSANPLLTITALAERAATLIPR